MKSSPRHLVVWCLIVAACLVGITAWLEVKTNRIARASIAGRMSSVGHALERYADKHGALPPLILEGPDGTPYHSWRALLLEFLDSDMYAKYDYTLPWNHDHNRQVARLFNPFGSPGTESIECQLFRVALSKDQKDGVDGASNVIAIIEVRNKSISWTEPVDLRPEDVDKDLLRDEPYVYIFRKGHSRLCENANPVLVREAFVRPLEAQVLRSLLRYSTNKPL